MKVQNTVIHLEGLSKHFKVLNRREGLGGSLLDLFSRNYRSIKAVENLSLDIRAGEIVGFLGPNGAGKSTAIKMMTGVLSPTSGVVSVNGMNPFKERIRFVRGIGVVFGQRTQLWWELPVRESFRLLKEIFAIPTETYERNLKRFEELVNLKELYGQQVRNLSLGQRMLCDIAASFLHNPSIIFLDEPTIGLDVAVKAQIRTLIRELNRENGTTIILTTHDIGDVEALCKRIVLIDKGQLIYDGETESFNRIFGSYRTLRLLSREGETENMLRLLPVLGERFKVSAIDVENAASHWFSVTVDQDKTSLSDVLSWALTNLPVQDVKIQEISTESVIAKVYAGGMV
ncbi:MAG TPA: ATP-binding cassette domain-containing protein [Treponemataceae bacterium]|nr:ATP-binding cassette domain-containing protein [Treponemataceae bacterium]